MTSYLLGIHTSTPTLALGLYDLDFDRQLGAQSWFLDRQMSSQLHPCLGDFFPANLWPQITALAVTIGPGSFTSCRLGVTVARTLGQALKIPVFGLSSLEAIAADHFAKHRRTALSEPRESLGTVAVQMDAKRGEWFAGIYQQQAEGEVLALVSDRLWSDAEWREKSEGLEVLDAKHWEKHPPVEPLMSLAANRYRSGRRPSWQEILPFYGRKPPIHRG